MISANPRPPTAKVKRLLAAPLLWKAGPSASSFQSSPHPRPQDRSQAAVQSLPLKTSPGRGLLVPHRQAAAQPLPVLTSQASTPHADLLPPGPLTEHPNSQSSPGPRVFLKNNVYLAAGNKLLAEQIGSASTGRNSQTCLWEPKLPGVKRKTINGLSAHCCLGNGALTIGSSLLWAWVAAPSQPPPHSLDS